MKKLNLKSLTITISLLFSLGASAYDFTVDGMYFNIVSLDDLTCEITQGDEKYTGDFVIPEQVTFNGRTLTIIRIDDYAFKGCDTLTSVKISDAVADIGSSAFEDCTKLTNVIISESVTTIGDSTFKGCANLSNVNIPESTTTIGNSTFEGCINLTNVNIPESVTTVGNSAFRYCN